MCSFKNKHTKQLRTRAIHFLQIQQYLWLTLPGLGVQFPLGPPLLNSVHVWENALDESIHPMAYIMLLLSCYYYESSPASVESVIPYKFTRFQPAFVRFPILNTGWWRTSGVTAVCSILLLLWFVLLLYTKLSQLSLLLNGARVHVCYRTISTWLCVLCYCHFLENVWQSVSKLKVLLITFLYRHIHFFVVNSTSTELLERCRIKVSLFLKNV